MGILDDPINPYAVENLRRSIAMLATGRAAQIDRDRALALLEELQRLQEERRTVASQLRTLLGRLEASGRHPSAG